jgi:hypothetical protein
VLLTIKSGSLQTNNIFYNGVTNEGTFRQVGSMRIIGYSTNEGYARFNAPVLMNSLVTNASPARFQDNVYYDSSAPIFAAVEVGVKSLVVTNTADMNTVTASNLTVLAIPGTAPGGVGLVETNGVNTMWFTGPLQLGETRTNRFNPGTNLVTGQSITPGSINANGTVGSWTNGFVGNRFRTSVVAGAGTGSTNYTLVMPTHADSMLGSSNVWITGIMGTDPTLTDFATVTVTNLSANNWFIGFSSVSNRWTFSGTYGTNAPTVLTNNTKLFLAIVCHGTNCDVGYTYFRPGL